MLLQYKYDFASENKNLERSTRK